MSMLEQITKAVSRVPSASTLDESTVIAVGRAVIAELKNPTMHMIVYADDHTLPDSIEENRVEWFKRMIDAAMIELAPNEHQQR